jgi:N-acetylglucosamine kinase-like BadF-type ATPase
MKAQYFLGVDIGNSKSHALICNETGNAIGVGVDGPGNHESLGKAGFQLVLQSVTYGALDSAGITGEDITGAGFGIAGFDWSEDEPLMHEVIHSLGFKAPYAVMNDAGPGLLAGSSNGLGVSITAGTSVNARGRNAQGWTARISGNGAAFGEVGGGIELVNRVIQAISMAWSLRGPQTILTDLFVKYVGAKNAEDLLAGIARGRYHIHAAAALEVFKAAETGDKVAQDAIRWIGRGLGDLACGIIHQLEIEHIAFDVVLSGSIFQGSPMILECMREEVHKVAPQARFVHLSAPPVTGAVMLAMERVGVDFRPLRETILNTGPPMLLVRK